MMPMTRIQRSLFTIVPAVLLLCVLPFNRVVYADTRVITGDGREVLLRDDGTWAYGSTDRLLNTGDGRQIRLKEDGHWEYTGNAPVVEDRQVKTRELGITLRKAVIEKYQIKVQKSLRLRTQTVFYLDIELSPLAASAIAMGRSESDGIEVSDNNGDRYPVLSVQSDVTTLQPGSKTGVTVRVKGSPSWLDNARTVQIEFRPGVFGNTESISLSQRVDDFDEIDVDGF